MRVLSTLVATAILIVPRTLVAQEPESQLPALFSEVIEVRVVNIEVVVTDQRGERVTGLQPEDFRLRVDGEEVPIDYFTEILSGTAAAEPARTQVATVPSLVPGEPVATNYLVFIDNLFAIARDRNLVLEAMDEDLQYLRPQDRMAVVAFDGRNLNMLSSWTSSERELRGALQEARGLDSYGLQRLGELRANDQQRIDRRALSQGTIARIEAAGGEGPEPDVMRTRLDPIELDFTNRLTNQVERSVLGAVSTMRSFGGPPGRKVMLILSGGWPFSPAEYVVNDFGAPVEANIAAAFDTGLKARNALFAPLADTANLLGYTLYPIDVPGMRRETPTDASRSAEDFSSAPDATLGTGTIPREEQTHYSLNHLAEETGGQALLNADRRISLEHAATDTSSYYWLGFTPQRQEDDERHRIEVEVVGRQGLRVRAREGFVDLSRSTEVTMMVESSLLFGNPPSEKPLHLSFGKPRKAGGGKMTIHLEVGIPLDHITLLPTNDRWVNELEIRTTVMDEKGFRSETPVDTVPINGSRPPRPGDVMWYETELSLRRRPHRLVVAVYDPLSGVILSNTVEIDPKG